MEEKKYLFILILIILATSSYSNNISSCSDDPNISGIWKLNQSISTSSGDCLSISISDVILDCQGYLINSTNNSATTYGIQTTPGFENITIQNCNIKNFGTNNNDAGLRIRGDYKTIKNNNLSNNYIGLDIQGKYYNLSNINSSNNFDGIRLNYFENSTIKNTVTNKNSNTGIKINWGSNINNFSNIISRYNNFGIELHSYNSPSNNSFNLGDIRNNSNLNIRFYNIGSGNQTGNKFSNLYIGNASNIGTNTFNFSQHNNIFDNNFWDDFNSTINPPYCYYTIIFSFCDTNAKFSSNQIQSNPNLTIKSLPSISLTSMAIIIIITTMYFII